jgi:aminomuconate-semialdehyde/2-hydroxymuconate-6-semialdehyde dehydrogenase
VPSRRGDQEWKMNSLDVIPCFIDGKTEEGRSYFEKRYPATGQPSAKVVESDLPQVDRAVEAARAALSGPWKKTTMLERAAFLERLADKLDERIDELVEEEIRDTGKPIAAPRNAEIPRAIANFRAFAAIAREDHLKSFQTKMLTGGVAENTILRQPIGVIGIVAPWNLPLLLLTWKVAPALVCGNAIVVKPSEHSPRTAVLLARIAHEAGLPRGLLNVVHGHGSDAAGSFLVSHPDVNAITFTGETRTGEAIMKAAATVPRPVSLELGGKNAAVMFDDADFEAAAAGTVRSMFDNCGQVCLTTERIFVHRKIFEPFVERLASLTKKLQPGDPRAAATTLGPAISDIQRDKVLGFYRRAAADGAHVVTGGDVLQMPAPFADGYWVAPTIWTGLPDEADVCRKEVFGPCGHISVFDDDDEVVSRVNNSSYGLASSVWTRNMNRARKVAAEIEAGTVWVNCWRVRDERAAFGGFKRSGIGREGGAWSLDFYSELKTVCSYAA